MQANASDVFVTGCRYHDMGLIRSWLTSLYFGFPLVMSPLAFLARRSMVMGDPRHRGTLARRSNFAYDCVCARSRPADLRRARSEIVALPFNSAEREPKRSPVSSGASRNTGCARAVAPVFGRSRRSGSLQPPGADRDHHIERDRFEFGRALPAS